MNKIPLSDLDTDLRTALDENELAARWGLSVKTLRRWRQEQLGPAFREFDARVTYRISDIEAFERHVSRRIHAPDHNHYSQEGYLR